MKLDSGGLTAAIVAVAVPLTMAGLARLFPAGPAPASTLPLEELQARYRRWELGLGLSALLLCVPVGLALWVALRGLAGVLAALAPPAEVAWSTGQYYWAVPAILLAITLTMPISDWMARRLLGPRHAEYQAYLQLKTGIDLARVARLLGLGAALVCAVFIFLGLDWWVRLDADGLAVNRYLGIGEVRHAFRDVRAVRTAPTLIAPNGNLVRRREYVVTFADGGTWSTNNLLAEPSAAEKRQLAEGVAARSGTSVEEVEVFRNDEL